MRGSGPEFVGERQEDNDRNDVRTEHSSRTKVEAESCVYCFLVMILWIVEKAFRTLVSSRVLSVQLGYRSEAPSC